MGGIDASHTALTGDQSEAQLSIGIIMKIAVVLLLVACLLYQAMADPTEEEEVRDGVRIGLLAR